MQRLTATVRNAGSMLHTAVRSGMSPAEVVILKFLHGDDAIQDMKMDLPVGQADFSVAGRAKELSEEEYLRTRYGHEVYEKCFSGPMTRLPKFFREININIKHETEKTLTKERMAKMAVPEEDSDEDLSPEELAEMLGMDQAFPTQAAPAQLVDSL